MLPADLRQISATEEESICVPPLCRQHYRKVACGDALFDLRTHID